LPAALNAVPGTPIRLLDGDQWLEGTLVDSAVTDSGPDGGATIVFAVAPIPSGAVETVEYEGRSYRCATM
jgi:hypothetical protein